MHWLASLAWITGGWTVLILFARGLRSAILGDRRDRRPK
jgi:hypothetical protein